MTSSTMMTTCVDGGREDGVGAGAGAGAGAGMQAHMGRGGVSDRAGGRRQVACTAGGPRPAAAAAAVLALAGVAAAWRAAPVPPRTLRMVSSVRRCPTREVLSASSSSTSNQVLRSMIWALWQQGRAGQGRVTCDE